jgi:drug/metabolite transporter (DMT)-like permease
MIFGGASMLLLAAASGETVHGMPSTRSLWAMAYLTVFGSIVAFTAYTWLLRNVRPTVATSYAYVNPLVAVALGWYFGNEPLGATTLFAAALSIGGVALIARKGASAATARDSSR